LRIFPEAADRAVTIYNMVSPQYFVEDSSFEEVRTIIPLRRSLPVSAHEDQSNDYKTVSPKFKSATDEAQFFATALHGDFRYLLVVSTIDPRKNHATCIAAWQALKRKQDPSLKLVFVGSLGWDYGPLTKDLTTELANGDLFLLDGVPTSELRLLYRHASATVCPSFAEGFDFSGVEAMRCGGVVVASDIAVHREVYEDAAEYFDPYSSDSAMTALSRVLYDKGSELVQSDLRRRGDRVSTRYLPEHIMPRWKAFLEKVSRL
jgi:glycosyltransferase involved in cell wall biosynthesis